MDSNLVFIIKPNIDNLVKQALSTGNWMLRRSSNGRAYRGFQWSPIGEWTEAHDWNNNPKPGGGLHGNGPQSSGYWTEGESIDFCLIDPDNKVSLGREKIKVKRAMVLLRNELPEGLTVGGWLYLRNSGVTQLPNNLTVRGALDLRNTQIDQLPEDLTVGGGLDIRGSLITHLPEGLTVGGWLYLNYGQIAQMPNGLVVKGSIHLDGSYQPTAEKDVYSIQIAHEELKEKVSIVEKLNV